VKPVFLLKALSFGVAVLASLSLEGADFDVIDATGGGVAALRGVSYAFSKAENCSVSVNRRDAVWGLEKLKQGDVAVLVLDEAELPTDFKAAFRMDLAVESLILYVNVQNPLRKITRNGAVELLTAAVPSWAKWNGDRSEVHRYRVKGAREGRGTAERFTKKPLPGGYFELKTLPELLMLASTDPKALVIGRYQDLFPEEVYPLAVDGVMPSLKEIRSGRYPFSRRIVLVSRLPKEDPKLAGFRKILLERAFYDDLLDEGLLPSAALAK